MIPIFLCNAAAVILKPFISDTAKVLIKRVEEERVFTYELTVLIDSWVSVSSRADDIAITLANIKYCKLRDRRDKIAKLEATRADVFRKLAEGEL